MRVPVTGSLPACTPWASSVTTFAGYRRTWCCSPEWPELTAATSCFRHLTIIATLPISVPATSLLLNHFVFLGYCVSPRLTYALPLLAIWVFNSGWGLRFSLLTESKHHGTTADHIPSYLVLMGFCDHWITVFAITKSLYRQPERPPRGPSSAWLPSADTAPNSPCSGSSRPHLSHPPL